MRYASSIRLFHFIRTIFHAIDTTFFTIWNTSTMSPVKISKSIFPVILVLWLTLSKIIYKIKLWKSDIVIKCMHSVQWSLKLSDINTNLSGWTLVCKLFKFILHQKKFIHPQVLPWIWTKGQTDRIISTGAMQGCKSFLRDPLRLFLFNAVTCKQTSLLIRLWSNFRLQ
jgi:hypothetical protein